MATAVCARDHQPIHLQIVVEYIQKRLPRLRSTSFAIDLALVALSIRAAHLVDAFTPKKDARNTFSSLLHRLRQANSLVAEETEPSVLFIDVVHVYEPTSEQSFFINAPLFLDTSPPHCPVFISADSSPHILTEPPQTLPSLLHDLTNQLIRHSSSPTITIDLPQDLSPASTVPLAAILLEYPVAYCPPATINSEPLLGGVTLDVYQVSLNNVPARSFLNNNSHHVLLKFSCPSHLGSSYPDRLSPELTMVNLRSLFESRMMDHVDLESVISIHHEVQTLDRVAL
ncbi:hypothetical protein D9757_005504 [Collybiopsis confluens]|uniref:Uncharacterized protein n=1 Tax=Collybiopsis confluens TaxID=2823264 RepID=A0A8H5HLR6_9AGAR|nr:hypothetical protein D9757_005504 [Collybiopsis confluens]